MLYSVPHERIEALNRQICAYLGLSPKIVSGEYTEDEFAAFYESIIEPLALQMSFEFSRKCGAGIRFTAERLEFSSARTRISLFDESRPIDPVPKFLMQVSGAKNLFGMGDGDGRNSALFSRILHLISAGFGREEVRVVLRLIKKYIFAEPLPDEELEKIMRDEAFDGIENDFDVFQDPGTLIKPAAAVISRDVPWLLDGFLIRGAITGFHGLPDSGKSWLTCTLTVAVANGSEFPRVDGTMIKLAPGRVLLTNFDDALEFGINPDTTRAECGNIHAPLYFYGYIIGREYG